MTCTSHTDVQKRKEYLKQYHKTHYSKHKEDYINNKKKQRIDRKKWFLDYRTKLICPLCGLKGIDNPYAISFHHLDPNVKENSISKMVRDAVSEEKILSEISKCTPICENCHRKLHYIENHKHITKSKPRLIRVEYVRNYKTKKGCSVCGEKDYRCLDMHHIDPKTKEDRLAGMVVRSYSLEEIGEELSKCECLCANCHQKLHRDSNN